MADIVLNFDDIYKLPAAEFNEVAGLIEGLSDGFKKSVKEFQAGSKLIVKAQQAIGVEIDLNAKKLEKLSVSEKNEQIQIEQLTSDIEAQANAVKELNKLREAQEKQIKQLQGDIKKLNDVIKKNKTTENQRLQVQKEGLKLSQKEQATLIQKIKLEAQKLRSVERANAENRKANRESEKLQSQYKRESKRLNELRLEYKDTALSTGRFSKESRKLSAQILKLDVRLKQVDADTGQFQRNVGNYPKIIKPVLMALGALGLVGGITAVVEILKSSIKTYAKFEASNSKLQAVLDATKQEMSELRLQAQALGASTAFTASEVTDLQTEFAKLNFPTNDILNLTKSTLDAAAAMGSDLAETAKLTGSILKSFQLDSSEAARVNDVLAKSTAASALDFEKLSSSMSTIAPVAKAFGFSVEATVALLGNLADAGFDASSAATATRNIILNLADSSSALSKSLKEPVKDLPSLVNGLKQLKDEGVDLATALELTDKRSVAAFSTFLEGTDSVLKLNDALENAGGTAERMGRIQLDNLTGDVKILNSAWEGFVLSLLAGDGAFSKVSRGIVEAAIGLLNLITPLEDTNKLTFENALANKAAADSSERLLEEYEKLTQDGVEPTADETQRLSIITLQLKDNLGDSVVAINEETGAFELNTEAVKRQITAKRLASDQEAATLVSRLKGVKDDLKRFKIQEKNANSIIKIRQKEVTDFAEGSKNIRFEIARRTLFESANVIGVGKLRRTRVELNKLLGESENDLLSIQDDVLKAGEEEAELIEQLTKLRFNLSTIEEFFTTQKKKNTKSQIKDVKRLGLIEEAEADLKDLRQEKNKTRSEDEIERINIEIEAKQNELKFLKDFAKEDLKQKTEAENKRIAIEEANAARSINLIKDRLSKSEALENTKFERELRQAKKNGEDLELVFQNHKNNLDKIRTDFSADIESLENEILFQEQKLDIIQSGNTNLDKELREIERNRLNNEVIALKDRLDLFEEGSIEFLEVQKELNAKLIQIREQDLKDFTDTEEKKRDELQKTLDKLKEFVFASSDLINVLFESRQIDREREFAAIEEDEQKKIDAAGNNEAAKVEIQKEAEAKKRKLEKEAAEAARRQAIFNKAIAVAEVIANFNVAQAKAAAALPFPLNLIGIAAMVTLAGLQLAAILATKIPSLEKGRDGGPATLAEINEAGQELRLSKKGELSLLGGEGFKTKKGELDYLNKGDSVLTAKQSKPLLEIINNGGMPVVESLSNNYNDMMKNIVITNNNDVLIDYRQMGKEFGKQLDKRPSYETVIDNEGNLRRFFTKGNSRIENMNKRHHLRRGDE